MKYIYIYSIYSARIQFELHFWGGGCIIPISSSYKSVLPVYLLWCSAFNSVCKKRGLAD